MKRVIYHLSDWHTLYDLFAQQLDFEIRTQKLEEPDLVILTGDMIRNWKPRLHDFAQQEELMQRMHYEHMIEYLDNVWPGVDIFGIRGNHDWCDYEVHGSVKAFDKLEGQTYEWNGYKIHGFRGMSYWMGNWQDEYREEQLQALCDLVPRDTNILITHEPPEGILDDSRDFTCPAHGVAVPCPHKHSAASPYGMSLSELANPVMPRNIGSPAIRDLVLNQLPVLQLHVFGHIHEQGGNIQVRGNKVFSNAAGTLNKVVLYDNL